jgi:hypothetical protein
MQVLHYVFKEIQGFAHGWANKSFPLDKVRVLVGQYKLEAAVQASLLQNLMHKLLEPVTKPRTYFHQSIEAYNQQASYTLGRRKIYD